MQALELMKTHVVKITPDCTIGEAVDLMDLYRVNGLPVVDADGVLCGILTEHDVMQAVRSDGAPNNSDQSPSSAVPRRHTDALLVRSFMSTPVQSVMEHDDALLAARLLLEGRAKHLPVVDRQGRVVGMLDRVDVLQSLFEGTLEYPLQDGS